MQKIKHHTKKIIITVIGWCTLIMGLIMLVTPGPGWVFIILGLGILATEYAWAYSLQQKAKNRYEKIKAKALQNKTQKATKNLTTNNK